MPDSAADVDLLERLADEFAARCRHGESPSAAEYAARFPEHADRIRELFPLVAAMEELRHDELTQRAVLARRNAPMNLPPRLGDFRPVRELGRGGMGIVYEAEQCSLARRVAVKVLPQHALLREKNLQRFEREARLAARLHHTNIVTVFGVGEHGGLHYYVMPLVRGVGLDELIAALSAEQAAGAPRYVGRPIDLVRRLAAAKFGPKELPAGSQDDGRFTASSQEMGYSRWVATVGIQAADALDYAHRNGTLHRDIKPGNLLLDENGMAYVADFGLARAIEADAAHSGDCVGTARYLAPEQLAGTADARSDIHALGLTLYELLTLQPARNRRRGGMHDSPPHACEPQRPRQIRPDVPRDLETIVLKCLTPEPDKRYQTAAALRDDLRRFLDDRPIQARRASMLERVGRWRRRNPALAVVSGLALLSLLAFCAAALHGHLRTQAAYHETQRALRQSELTSQLSLEVLNDIYAQLAPERVWIAWDFDPAGQMCACVGLSAGDGAASVSEKTALQRLPTPESAALLDRLLVFYDRLANESGEEPQVVLQSAAASRRVGNLRLRLGQIDLAEKAYRQAIDKLTALQARKPLVVDFGTELARNYNELGNACFAGRRPKEAHTAHRAALATLQAIAGDGPFDVANRYELARTYYFLARRNGAAGPSTAAETRAPWPAMARGQDEPFAKKAIAILKNLIDENHHAPDYRLLVALCHRDVGAVGGRQQAIAILENLVAEYLEVADYRYELIATYAWFPVGLFPWQKQAAVSPEDEHHLRRAVDEAERLVARHPAVPQYARSQAIVLAKLATVCSTDSRLSDAESLLAKSVKAQQALVASLADVAGHDRVLLEFLHLKLLRLHLDRLADTPDSTKLGEYRDAIEGSRDALLYLSKTPELAGDQLLRNSLSLANMLLRR